MLKTAGQKLMPSMERLFTKFKLIMFGTREKSGLIGKIVVYFLLINVVLIYLEPVFYMITTAFKSMSDIMDITVGYIPKNPTFSNMKLAFNVLEYFKGLWTTLKVVFPCALLHVVTCAIAGYAIARLDVPGKKLIVVLLILCFIIPPQIVIIPIFFVFHNLEMVNTPMPFIIPAIFGHGIKAPLFILIYIQYFRTQPSEIEDAARIDGASSFRTFWKVMFPLAKPVMIVVFLFSVIWHWNETFQYMILMGQERPLSLRISDLRELLSGHGEIGNVVAVRDMRDNEGLANETATMAGCILVILPTVILYAFTQRWFTEGIERTGLVE